MLVGLMIALALDGSPAERALTPPFLRNPRHACALLRSELTSCWRKSLLARERERAPCVLPHRVAVRKCGETRPLHERSRSRNTTSSLTVHQPILATPVVVMPPVLAMLPAVAMPSASW